MSASVLPNDPTVQPSRAPIDESPSVVVVPDRADAPISEITERFFRALLLKVPLERIEELHLFSPLRQGGVETGIAVIAAREEILVEAASASSPLEIPFESATDEFTTLETVAANVADLADVVNATDVPDGADVSDAAAVSDVSDVLEDEEDAIADEESPYAVNEVEALEPVEAAEPLEPIAPVDAAGAVERVIRHTVYTARYRLVQKGPERGKWEADVVAEAEAPLITVETVVRGVQRRAGEESDTTRFSAAQIARALRLQLGAA